MTRVALGDDARGENGEDFCQLTPPGLTELALGDSRMAVYMIMVVE